LIFVIAGCMAGSRPAVAQTTQPAAPTDVTTSAPSQPGMPPDPQKLVEDALVKIDQGDFQAAAELVNKASQSNQKIDKIHLASGLLMYFSNKGPEAVSELSAYCRSPEGKKDHRGYDALGQVYLKSRNYRQARENFTEAAKYAPVEEKGEPVRARSGMDIAYI